ncbi:hypothetical protein J7T55_010594 [Diaporthe amygdali]|uniref:uncharacterized protein n=1 Tax=Phomopsis amygdali TaxID=1214568 RepID=UPI0022FE4F6A|nr:uncharacterized protein J7T55_010594 [Diaporthe amygdali]KAJ0115771.1 hypothetical protein J7T55_010594 [Diaporthe amygdali]
MDPSGLPSVPAGANTVDDEGSNNDGNNNNGGNGGNGAKGGSQGSQDNGLPLGWPFTRPTREALDFLELPLTTGVPRPVYHNASIPLRRVDRPEGVLLNDPFCTLPLEIHLADYLNVSPEPYDEPAESNSPTMMPSAGNRDAQARVLQAHNAVQQTTSVLSPPRGIFSRPRIRNLPRKRSRSQHRGDRTEPENQDEVFMGAEPADIPKRPQSTVRFLVPQNDQASAPPKTVEARPRRMVTIRSHAAARMWRELEKHTD